MHSEKPTPILDLLLLILKNWKLVAAFNGIVGVVAILMLLSMDLTYQSTAVVSVEEESGGAGIASMISEVMPFSLGFGGGSEVQKYMGMLELRRVMDVIIEKYALQEVYEKKTMLETYRAVKENLAVYDREDGTFSISYFFDNEPAMARDIVATLFEELKALSIELNQQVAKKYRSYIEQAFQKAAYDLEQAELNFTHFQSVSGILKIEEQVGATINSISELEMMKIKAQLELEFMQNSLGKDHPEILGKKLEVSTIVHKIDDLSNGNSGLFLAINDLPLKSMEYVRLFRDLTVNTKIYEFLSLQYEQAKIEEMKSTVNLFLLDPPQIPDRKVKPKRLSILIAIMFFSSSISVIFLQSRNYYYENKNLIQTKLK